MSIRQFFIFPMFENRLPLDLSMELNAENKQFERNPDMFEILNEKDCAEITEKVDPNTNIVLCTPTEEEILKRNTNGSLSIITTNNINLSTMKSLINSLLSFPFTPKLKILVPSGINLNFKEPISSPYHNTFYKKINIESRSWAESDCEIPEYMIYNDLSFTIYFDLDQLKKHQKVVTLLKDTPLLNLEFLPIYYVGSTKFPNISKTTWIRSKEVYDKFEEIF